MNKEASPLGSIHVLVKSTLQALELNLITIELLQNHPARKNLLYTIEIMAKYLLKTIEDLEETVDQATRKEAEDTLHQSAFIRDTIADIQKHNKTEPFLRTVAEAVSNGHNQVVKALGAAENETIEEFSKEFRGLKNEIFAFLEKLKKLPHR